MDVKKKNSLQKNKQQKINKSQVEDSEISEQGIDWSNQDKSILLEALKKYGSENIAAISNMLPHLSPEDIKLKISEYSKMAKSLYENELLNKWSSCGLYKLGDSIVPEVLLLIHLFEDHPPLYEADGHDFRAIYEFLYRSCFEQTSYFDLPKKDMNLFCSTLIKIENKVWPYCQKDIWEYVGKVYKRRNIKKVYPGKNTQSL